MKTFTLVSLTVLLFGDASRIRRRGTVYCPAGGSSCHCNCQSATNAMAMMPGMAGMMPGMPGMMPGMPGMMPGMMNQVPMPQVQAIAAPEQGPPPPPVPPPPPEAPPVPPTPPSDLPALPEIPPLTPEDLPTLSPLPPVTFPPTAAPLPGLNLPPLGAQAGAPAPAPGFLAASPGAAGAPGAAPAAAVALPATAQLVAPLPQLPLMGAQMLPQPTQPFDQATFALARAKASAAQVPQGHSNSAGALQAMASNAMQQGSGQLEAHYYQYVPGYGYFYVPGSKSGFAGGPAAAPAPAQALTQFTANLTEASNEAMIQDLVELSPEETGSQPRRHLRSNLIQSKTAVQQVEGTFCDCD